MPSHEDWRSVLAEALGPERADHHGIPHILHHIFFPGRDALTPEARDNIAGLRTRNPGWEYRFYDKQSAETFISTHYGPRILAAFLRIHPDYYAARADFLRYLLCYAFGGVYLDIKSGADRPFDTVLRDDDQFLLSQWPVLQNADPATVVHPSAHDELRHVPGFEYVQWFVISAPRHPFLGAVIDAILERIDSYSPFSDGVGRMGVLRLTGPIAYTLDIAPLRHKAPHRFVDFEQDLGLHFSIYGNHKDHRARQGRHYSQLTRPVVENGVVATTATRVWYGGVQPQWRRVRNRVRRVF